jgi:transmembrane sensor
MSHVYTNINKPMTKELFLVILTNYLEGNATKEEKDFLYAYYNFFMADVDVIALLDEKQKDRLKSSMKLNIDHYIDSEIKPVKKINIWPRIAAAASIILVLSFGGYLLLHKPKPQQIVHIQHNQNDIAPIGYKATLTLSGGRQIVLDAKHNGQLAQQKNMVISQATNGIVTYSPNQQNNSTDNSLVYNTMTTGGGQYSLQLSDGTKVWLNSASSITYPVAFTGKDRKVEVTGEVYFEVAHNKAKPFSVTTHGQTIEVLGTHFNINAYDDEAQMQTTLLEGSIKISKADHFTTLTPGQQAQIRFDSDNIKISSVADVEQAIAWKNGLFSYDQTDLREVMRQLARAYEVKIEYEGKIPPRTFTGKIHRNISASEVLDILKFMRINFRLENKKIIVTP